MKSDDQSTLRKQLIQAIHGGESHIRFEQTVPDIPPEARGKKADGVPHTAWELLEHMRIAQRDILDFVRERHYKAREFPEGYWPNTQEPPDDSAWDRTVKAFEQDQHELADLVLNSDLFAPVPNGDGQTLLREAIVVANHNSYHLGQLVLLKRMLVGHA